MKVTRVIGNALMFGVLLKNQRATGIHLDNYKKSYCPKAGFIKDDKFVIN